MVNFFIGIIKFICWTILVIVGTLGFIMLMIPLAIAAGILALALPWIIILGCIDELKVVKPVKVKEVAAKVKTKTYTGKSSQFDGR